MPTAQDILRQAWPKVTALLVWIIAGVLYRRTNPKTTEEKVTPQIQAPLPGSSAGLFLLFASLGIATPHGGTLLAGQLGQLIQDVGCAHGEKLPDRLRFGKPRFNSRTPTGRATVWLLQMNTAERMELHAELRAIGRWPRSIRQGSGPLVQVKLVNAIDRPVQALSDFIEQVAGGNLGSITATTE